MLQKNKASVLGLLLMSGIVQFSSLISADKVMAPIDVAAKKIHTRYGLSRNGLEKIAQGVTDLTNASEFKSLSADKQLEAYEVIFNFHSSIKPEEFSVLTKTMKTLYGLEANAHEKIGEGFAELKSTRKFKALSVDRKNDVFGAIMAAFSVNPKVKNYIATHK